MQSICSRNDNFSNKFNELNNALDEHGKSVLLATFNSTSSTNRITLPEDINNYREILLHFVSAGSKIVYASVVIPIEVFKDGFEAIAHYVYNSSTMFVRAKYIDDVTIQAYVTNNSYSGYLYGIK